MAAQNPESNTDLFDLYFTIADLNQDGRISGAEAASFFQGANLPKNVLAQIWDGAAQYRNGFLGRAEFYDALKLTSVAQSKRELTPTVIKAALTGPASPKIPAPQINLATTNGFDKNSTIDLFDLYFRRADLNQDGRISGAEAASFFQGANLPKNVLAQIWDGVDRNRNGFLSRAEFYDALKLTTVAQSNRELTPNIINAALTGPASLKIPAPQINLAALTGPASLQIPAPQINLAATDDFDKNSITRLLSDLASEKPQPYSHAQLVKFTKEFSDLVGSGGFGDVYKGEFPNGVPIAVKVLKNSRLELMGKQFAAEVSTMGRTYHRNLIKLYGYCYEANTKALIYEYMEKGALDVILKKNNLDMVKLYTIAIEIARGISYLHESCYPQIIHHDLKPANVLLDSNFSPRVIDFGLARLNLEKSQFAQTGLRGTRGYVAPEMTQLELGMISYKCDVFSFGMILFDILKSKINYGGQGWLPGQVWEKFKENKLDSFLKDHGIKEDDKANAKTLSMVALSCAEYNPRNRPSMSTVVKMLEGEMTPRLPINPFPLYDSSSDSSTTYDSRDGP